MFHLQMLSCYTLWVYKQRCQYLDNTALNGKMIVNDELELIWKEVVVA
jgi:hypothetical protein